MFIWTHSLIEVPVYILFLASQKSWMHSLLLDTPIMRWPRLAAVVNDFKKIFKYVFLEASWTIYGTASCVPASYDMTFLYLTVLQIKATWDALHVLMRQNSLSTIKMIHSTEVHVKRSFVSDSKIRRRNILLACWVPWSRCHRQPGGLVIESRPTLLKVLSLNRGCGAQELPKLTFIIRNSA